MPRESISKSVGRGRVSSIPESYHRLHTGATWAAGYDLAVRAPAFAIVNPESGAGATGRRWPALRAQVEAAVGELRWAFSEAPGHATVLARDAVEAGHGRVIAVGGDGTLGEVVTGVFGSARPQAGLEPAVGLLPLGTGSDFARTLGIGSLPEALACLAAGKRRRIDLGRVAYIGHDGQPHERLFVNVFSFGCGGAVSEAISRSTKRLGGRLGFMLASARALVGYRDVRATLRVDDGPPESLAVTSYAVCNGRFFGGGMQVAPQAQPDDGRFDVTLWHGFGLADFVLRRRHIYDGTHVRLPGTRTGHARRVTAESAERVLIDVDGEPLGRLPVTVELLPAALDIIG